MNKAYKVPRPSRSFLSEVLPNCLTAGEPYIAYGLSPFFASGREGNSRFS